jgi:hypothetical protein
MDQIMEQILGVPSLVEALKATERHLTTREAPAIRPRASKPSPNSDGNRKLWKSRPNTDGSTNLESVSPSVYGQDLTL